MSTLDSKPWSRWNPLRFVPSIEPQNRRFSSVYLANDPNSLIITPEFDFPLDLAFPTTPTVRNLPSNALSQPSSFTDFTSPRRPNKLRKLPPKPPNLIVLSPSHAFPPLLHVLSSPQSNPTSTDANFPTVHPDPDLTSHALPLPPSPTPSATSASVCSRAPLLHSSLPSPPIVVQRPAPNPARKLTKRRRASSAVRSTYVKLLNDCPNAGINPSSPSAPFPLQTTSINNYLRHSEVDTSPNSYPNAPSTTPGLYNSQQPPQPLLDSDPSRRRRESMPIHTLYRGRTTTRWDPGPGPHELELSPRSISESRYRDAEMGSRLNSTEAEEFLPPVRAASPFRLNISTHQEWHERRTQFRVGTPPPSNNAEPLATFAWTGINPQATLPSTFSIKGKNRDLSQTFGDQDDSTTNEYLRPALAPNGGLPNTGMQFEPSTSPESSSSSSLSRPCLVQDTGCRQQTLAMAVTDEDVTDEVLVEELERLRSAVTPTALPRCYSEDQHRTSQDNPDTYGGPQGHLQGSQTPSSPFALPQPDLATWHTARRALLTCREIVRTERHYLTDLRVLGADGEGTTTILPAAMLTHVSALIRVSESLLYRMTEDPSAWGVAAAFLGDEDEMEEAFVKWCEVVGEIFVGPEGDRQRQLRRRSTGDAEDVFRSRSKSKTSIATAGSEPASCTRSGSRVLVRKRTSVTEKEMEGRKKKPTVRDLAILPTQRVTRYVLLYRDLLEYTPSSSPSRALVECAVEAALRIAKKCDEAQGIQL